MARATISRVMRTVAIGLLALAGCNQIFGLDAVKIADAPGDQFIPPPRVQLTLQVAKTKRTAVDLGPDPVLEQAPIPGAAVKIGLLDGSALIDAIYDPVDGGIDLPRQGFLGAKWRLEYTPVSGPPIELQWTPTEDKGHFIVPVFGRLERTPPPTASGYRISVSGGPASLTQARLFTTGIWMDIGRGTAVSPVEVPGGGAGYDQLPPQSGEKGVPDAAGDLGLLTIFAPAAGNCVVSSGSAAFAGIPLVQGSKTPITTEPFTNAGRTITVGYQPALSDFRLEGALDDRSPLGMTSTGVVAHGYAPHDRMPALTQTFLGAPAPLMIKLAECPFGATNLGPFSDPPELGEFPRIAYAEVTDTRMIGTTELVSSIATVSTATGSSFEANLGVPLALGPIALSDGATSFALSGPSDDIAVPVGTGSLDLTFRLEGVGTVEFFQVNVFRVDAALGLVAERSYIATDVAKDAITDVIVAPVRIDRAMFTAGNQYVFAIQTHRGRPEAGVGNFSTVAFPQAVATIFTRTIVVQ